MRSSPAWGRDPLRHRLSLLLPALVVGCAQQEMPPGGPEDLRPPVVVRTQPAALSEVEDLSTRIRFEFDERISERVSGGALETAVTLSPTSGEVRVGHGRRSLEVEVEGGLRAGVVYRVTLHPVVSDLFGNTLRDPFELVFSTGGDPVPTTLAGEVWDRITGQPMNGISLRAEGSDSLVHRSTADREGIFAFRYLSAGPLDVTAFEDRNRDGLVDPEEVQGSLPVRIEPGDTLLVDLPVLTPDTSAANLTVASAVDSMTVAVLFDDFLDFEEGTGGVEVVLASDSATPPTIVEVLHEPEYVVWLEGVVDSLQRLDSIDAAERAEQAAEAAAEAVERAGEGDSVQAGEPPTADTGAVADTGAAADTAGAAGAVAGAAGTLAGAAAAADTLAGVQPPAGAAPADTVTLPLTGTGTPQPPVTRRVPPPALPNLSGSTAGPTADGRRVLPGRRLVLRLGAPLPEDVPLTVTVTGVRNVWGLPDGGGEAELRWVPERDTIPAAADSAATGDTAAAADTTRAGTAPPDTGAVIPSGGSSSGGAGDGAVSRVRRDPARPRPLGRAP